MSTRGTKNKIEDLRDHLFAMLEDLRDDASKEPLAERLERARAVSDVSRRIIESAKVEVDFLRVTCGDVGSGFIPQDRQLPEGSKGRNGDRARR